MRDHSGSLYDRMVRALHVYSRTMGTWYRGRDREVEDYALRNPSLPPTAADRIATKRWMDSAHSKDLISDSKWYAEITQVYAAAAAAQELATIRQLLQEQNALVRALVEKGTTQ